jgi:hypothetical protein
VAAFSELASSASYNASWKRADYFRHDQRNGLGSHTGILSPSSNKRAASSPSNEQPFAYERSKRAADGSPICIEALRQFSLGRYAVANGHIFENLFA